MSVDVLALGSGGIHVVLFLQGESSMSWQKSILVLLILFLELGVFLGVDMPVSVFFICCFKRPFSASKFSISFSAHSNFSRSSSTIFLISSTFSLTCFLEFWHLVFKIIDVFFIEHIESSVPSLSSSSVESVPKELPVGIFILQAICDVIFLFGFGVGRGGDSSRLEFMRGDWSKL